MKLKILIIVAGVVLTAGLVFGLGSCSAWNRLDNSQKGAVIGGTSGAAVGSTVGGAPGAVIGGAGGGIAGGVIGKEMDKDKKTQPKRT